MGAFESTFDQRQDWHDFWHSCYRVCRIGRDSPRSPSIRCLPDSIAGSAVGHPQWSTIFCLLHFMAKYRLAV